MAETNPLKLRVSREEARQKIQARIDKGQQLCSEDICPLEIKKAGIERKNWSEYNKTLLLRLFSNESRAVGQYIHFDNLIDPRELVLLGPDTPSHVKKSFLYEERINSSINSLERILDELELYDGPSDTPQPTFGDDVFIVHGRDEAAKHAMARFVERLGLKPIILDEQPDAGLTIIEKLEREAKNVGFAIALLTPDDVGALKDEADDQPKPRARQNVILELGYFMGKLGRKKVCLLIKGELENPSDLDGILYVPMNSPDGWQLQLAREMRQAGLPIDLNQLA